MDILQTIKELGFTEGQLQKGKNSCYLYAGENVVVGIGMGGDNRAKPLHLNDLDSVLSPKDAGKTFLCFCVSSITKQPIKLYSKIDNTREENKESEMERNTKSVFFKDRDLYVLFNGQSFTKKEFYSKIIVPFIKESFGEESREYYQIYLTMKDGDTFKNTINDKSDLGYKVKTNILKAIQDNINTWYVNNIGTI